MSVHFPRTSYIIGVALVCGACIALITSAYCIDRQMALPAKYTDKSKSHPEFVSALNAYLSIADYAPQLKGQVDLCEKVAVHNELAQCQYDLQIGKSGSMVPRTVKVFWISEQKENCVVLVTNLNWAGTTVNRAFVLSKIDGSWKVADSEALGPHDYTNPDLRLQFSCNN